MVENMSHFINWSKICPLYLVVEKTSVEKVSVEKMARCRLLLPMPEFGFDYDMWSFQKWHIASSNIACNWKYKCCIILSSCFDQFDLSDADQNQCARIYLNNLLNIKSIGNTCYLNSSLQIILSLTDVRRQLLKLKERQMCVTSGVLPTMAALSYSKELGEREKVSDILKNLCEEISKINPQVNKLFNLCCFIIAHCFCYLLNGIEALPYANVSNI